MAPEPHEGGAQLPECANTFGVLLERTETMKEGMDSLRKWGISLLIGIILAMAGNFYVQARNGQVHETDLKRIAVAVAKEIKNGN